MRRRRSASSEKENFMYRFPLHLAPKALQRFAIALPALLVLRGPASGAEYWLNNGVGVGTPAAARNNDGRLEMFARHGDGTIWHSWQDGTQAGGWSGWQSLGGSFSNDPVVAIAADGRLEHFVRTSTGTLAHQWRTGAAADSSWLGNWLDDGHASGGNPRLAQTRQ